MIIPYDTASDGPQPRQPRSVVTRAQAESQNNTAQPPLTSGFGAVIEKEHDLQNATENSFAGVDGPHGAGLDRILRQQHSQLGANLALLKQRYEALPDPGRVAVSDPRRRQPHPPRGAGPLPDLIARHTDLQADLAALIACGSDGQRGELILAQVSRQHEEMAWRLTALLEKGAAAACVVEGDGDYTTRI